MNFHQTKGREADAVILLIHDYRSRERSEPFPEGSLLLNVAISRAREQVNIILSENPHPLVEPLMALADRSR